MHFGVCSQVEGYIKFFFYKSVGVFAMGAGPSNVFFNLPL
jgi:hypothetical protein